MAGYLEILRDTVRRHGVPTAVYHDRHTIFVASTRTPLTLEEQLVDRRSPTQLGRAVGRVRDPVHRRLDTAGQGPHRTGLGHPPGPLGDRAADRRDGRPRDGQPGPASVRARFNRRFAVPPTDATPAWRPLPVGTRLDAVCALKYRRVVAPDHTVRVGATIVQLPATRGRRGYAHRRVDVEVRLDGRLIVWDGIREVLIRDAPADPVQLRALASARLDLGRTAPTPGSVQKPPRDHPWVKVRPGTKLYDRIQRERLSGSPSS